MVAAASRKAFGVNTCALCGKKMKFRGNLENPLACWCCLILNCR
jgi:hypothetical protein